MDGRSEVNGSSDIYRCSMECAYKFNRAKWRLIAVLTPMFSILPMFAANYFDLPKFLIEYSHIIA